MPLDPAKSLSRAQRDLSAHDFALAHKGRLAQLPAACVEDLAEEITNLKLAPHEADNRLAAEMAFRLDRATDWTQIIPQGTVGTPVGLVLEALDYFGYWLAAQGVIAAWRRLERRLPLLRGKLEALIAKLEEDDLLPQRRRRIERRITRLSKRVSA
mgnify:FL=1